jgi:hypothetical protein
MTGVTIFQGALGNNDMVFVYIDHVCMDNK